jgi:acyl-CoA thioesterase-2
MSSAPAVTLAGILEMEEIASDVWRTWTPPGSARSDIFGGQVAGQALRAAALTVTADHLPNSVHGYFLRRGQPALPLDVHVERVRSGRTYTSRRVDVRQEGKSIFSMLASFHAEEPGREFDHPMPSGIPAPELVPASDLAVGWPPALDVRILQTDEPLVRWWGRVPGPFPDDPVLHLCALLYASDLFAGGAAMSAIGHGSGHGPAVGTDGRPVGNFGSLDHALWFHRIPAVEDWFFCEVRPLTVRDSRGLVLGTMFDQSGRHLATFTQEMFLKVIEPGH